MDFLTRLETLPVPAAVAAGLAITGVVGALDVITGSELAFSTFSLVPIFVLTWTPRRPGRVLAAAVGTGFRTGADLTGRAYSHPLYLYGNIGMRLALFVVMAVLPAELRRLFDEQRAFAAVDHVTGTANRRAFLEALGRERARAMRYRHGYTIASIDVDDFKAVNDTRGHAAGDEVLRTVAESIRAHVRSIDTVGRLGGDEFGLLLPETDESQALSAVGKVRDGLLEDPARGGWGVTVPVGVFAVDDRSMDADAAMQAADAQMYAAKLSGKNAIRSASGAPAAAR